MCVQTSNRPFLYVTETRVLTSRQTAACSLPLVEPSQNSLFFAISFGLVPMFCLFSLESFVRLVFAGSGVSNSSRVSGHLCFSPFKVYPPVSPNPSACCVRTLSCVWPSIRSMSSRYKKAGERQQEERPAHTGLPKAVMGRWEGVCFYVVH